MRQHGRRTVAYSTWKRKLNLRFKQQPQTFVDKEYLFNLNKAGLFEGS